MRDCTGPPTCDWCGRHYPVSSLARGCETRHMEDDEVTCPTCQRIVGTQPCRTCHPPT